MNIKQKYDLALKALKEINDPIAAMRNNLKEGEILNGIMAVALSKDPEYLRNIAFGALSEINKIEIEEAIKGKKNE
jgi:hypothetical protein